jgi:D-psicose/D-tagatose/L-ribulose 3-epimerase
MPWSLGWGSTWRFRGGAPRSCPHRARGVAGEHHPKKDGRGVDSATSKLPQFRQRTDAKLQWEEPQVKIGLNLLVIGGFIGPADHATLKRIRDAGYDGVEIPVFSGETRDYQALAAVLDDLGLARTAVTIIPDVEHNPVSPDPSSRARARDRLHWAIDCMHALGATVMAGPYHSPLGVFTGNGPTEDELDHAAEVLHDAAGYAEAAGIRLAIEPLNRFECYVLNTLEQGSSLRRRVGHPNFSFMYDSFHANIEERDPIAGIGRYASEIAHIHISENDRGIPGRGHIPWRAVFDAIKGSGYDGWLTVEAFGRAVPELAAATRVWRDLFPDLPTLILESIALIRGELARPSA